MRREFDAEQTLAVFPFRAFCAIRGLILFNRSN